MIYTYWPICTAQIEVILMTNAFSKLEIVVGSEVQVKTNRNIKTYKYIRISITEGPIITLELTITLDLQSQRTYNTLGFTITQGPTIT